MLDHDAGEIAVIDADGGPGATAVLHGMLSTLSEVLGGLDERLERLEARLDRTAEAVASLGVGVSSLSSRFDELAEADDEVPAAPVIDVDVIGAAVADRMAAAVEVAVDRLGEQVDGVRQELLASVSERVEGVGARLDAVPEQFAERVAATVEVSADRISVELGELRSGLAEQVAERLAPAVVALPQQVATALAEHMAALAASLPEEVAAGLRDHMASILASLPERLAGTVRQAVGEQVEALAAAMPDQVADRLAGPLEAVGSAVPEGLSDRLDALAVSLPEQVASRLSGRLDGLAEAVADWSASDTVLARLADLSSSVDAVAYGVSSVTEALQSTDGEPDVDVVAVVTAEAERIRATVAALGQAVTAAHEAADLSLRRLDERQEAVHDLAARAATAADIPVVAVVERTVAQAQADLRHAFDEAMLVLADRQDGTARSLVESLEAVRAELTAGDNDIDIADVLARHAAGSRDDLDRLETVLRGQVAEVAGRAGSITEVIGRLDGRLHEVVDGVRALTRNLEALRRQEQPV